jgi:hypothetical protein
VTRALVTLSARYPGGALGWVLDYLVVDDSPEEFLGGRFPSVMLDYAITHAQALYHAQVGPAYALDDFTYTIWVFETPEEMFHACGVRMLETDGVVADFARPETRAPNYY